ncbi:MAG TPA: Flp pilus assembly protein CpaB [Sphingomicrobium sp.]|nr:Flp pilus assembly protein CpaB [Sphingomicrobium sp.]
MNFKKVVLLVGALMVAAITAVMAKNMFTGAGAKQAEAAPAVPMGTKVLVAKKNLPVGTIIDATMLGFQPWPKEMLAGAYYMQGAADSDPSKLLGTVVRYPVTAGQPITRGALVGPQDRGFLAAALGPGMRAVTVPVSTERGVAGFVFPGDRVDLVLTQEVEGDGPSLRVSETIVRNVRVLATDQRIDRKDESGKIVVEKFENVTLEATPRIAEKIAVAQSIGDLSLSLRSIADNSAELERAVASGEVKVPEGTSPADERRLLTAYASRPMDNNPTFTTGGHVSRFQRRTAPPQKSSKSELDDASKAMNKFADALTGGGQPAAPTGPVVRVARGNSVTVVPVGAR